MHVHTILANKGSSVSMIRPSASLALAITRFRAENIGALVVVDPNGTILGLVTEREVVHGLAEDGVQLLERSVEEVMHRRPATCSPDDEIKDVMATMIERRVRHVPVVADGGLAGIVSLGDLVKNRLDEMALEANVLRDAYAGRN